MIHLLTAIGLTPGGSSTVNIYTQTIHRTTQSIQTMHRTTQLTNWEGCGPCPVFVSYTLAFALQLRKKHGKTSVRVAGECHRAYMSWKYTKRTTIYTTIRKNQKNITTLQHFAALHHTSPNYTSLHWSTVHALTFTLHCPLIWLNPFTFIAALITSHN